MVVVFIFRTLSTLSSLGSAYTPLDLTLLQSRDKKISILKIRLLLIRVIQFKRLVVEYMMGIQNTDVLPSHVSTHIYRVTL